MKTIETMKTKKAMKTKTNFRKAALRSAAVVVSFVLVSITVSAQEFWKKVLIHSSFNEIAIAMVETSKKESPAHSEMESNWYSFDKAFDPALELEGWMTSENYFLSTAVSLENEMEAPLALESWMLDENVFYSHKTQEAPLEVESWMTSADFWSM